MLQITSQTIDELNPALFRFALRFVHRPEEAEDLVQETWLNALRGASHFDGRSSLRAWLNGILRRRAVDHFRRTRPTTPFDDQLADDTVSPLEQLDSENAAFLAAAAAADLPLLERTAVMLCDVQDVDRDRAAAQMQISRGHLRVVLHRAHQKLVHALHAHGVVRN